MLQIKNVTKSFGDKVLYKNVNLEISATDKIGLVGLNGSGKSTFLNLISGKQLADEGDIIWQGKHTLGVLDQHAEIDGELTVLDYLRSCFSALYDLEKRANAYFEQSAIDVENSQNLIEKGCKIIDELNSQGFYEVDAKIKKVASGLGFTQDKLDLKVKNLSGGQRAKLILCKLLLDEPDLMILDEPTNHLDVNNIEWLKNYLNNYKKAFLLVSHDASFLDAVCNVIWSVEFFEIKKYSGNYSQFLKQHEQNLETYNANYEKQQKQIEKLEDYIARNKVRTATAKQAQSRMKILEKMDKIEKLQDPPVPILHFAYKNTPNDVAILTQKLAVGFSTPLQKDITFTLKYGDKLLISGFNGIGKTTLLRTLIGEIPKLSGEIVISKIAKIGYMQQNLDWEDKTITPIEHIQNAFPKLDIKQVRGYLAKAGLTAKQVLLPIERLSGGEQTKLKLCQLLIEPHNLLILDEPNNHLDKNAKEALAKVINEFKGACIIVSHEKGFNKLLKFDELHLNA